MENRQFLNSPFAVPSKGFLFSKLAITPKPEALRSFQKAGVPSQKRKSWTKKNPGNFFFKNPIVNSHKPASFQNMRGVFEQIPPPKIIKPKEWTVPPINIAAIEQVPEEDPEVDLVHSILQGVKRNPSAFQKLSFSKFNSAIDVSKLHSSFISICENQELNDKQSNFLCNFG